MVGEVAVADNIDDDLFEIPPEILAALTPSELSRADQLIAGAKTHGRGALAAGGDFEAAIEAMAEQLLELMDLIENALIRFEESKDTPGDEEDDLHLRG